MTAPTGFLAKWRRAMNERYERPQVWDLGKVAELTRMPPPPGKTGRGHDGSRFLADFSCFKA